MRVFLQVHSLKDHEEFLQGLIAERIIRRRIEQMKHYRSLGIRTFAETEVYSSEKKKRDTEKLSTRKSRDNIYNFPGGSTDRLNSRSSRWLNRERDREDSQKKTRTSGAPLDIRGAPGAELLSTREKDLCSSLRLFPQQYMVIKETLFRESLRSGGSLKKAIARQLIKIDVNKTSRIFDFFEQSGWINVDKKGDTTNGT